MTHNIQRYQDALEVCNIPEHMRDGVLNYITKRERVGSFLRAVITNDLKGAYLYADDINSLHVKNFVHFFYMHAPSLCWGSEHIYYDWLNGDKDD